MTTWSTYHSRNEEDCCTEDFGCSFSRLKTRADSTLTVRICCSQHGCSTCNVHSRGLPETEKLYLFTESKL